MAIYLLAVDVQRLHLGCNDANERHLLLNVQTLAYEVTAEPPHVVPSKVLVLKHKLDVLRAELEIELPCRYLLWKVSLLIRQSEPNLDNLEEVDVTSHRLVVVVR